VRTDVIWRRTGRRGLRWHQRRSVAHDGHERVTGLWRGTDEGDGHGVRARITRLDLGHVIGLGPVVMCMRAGEVQVRGDAVLVILVVVTGERMHVLRQRRR
jgi:hypothetical protein